MEKNQCGGRQSLPYACSALIFVNWSVLVLPAVFLSCRQFQDSWIAMIVEYLFARYASWWSFSLHSPQTSNSLLLQYARWLCTRGALSTHSVPFSQQDMSGSRMKILQELQSLVHKNFTHWNNYVLNFWRQFLGIYGGRLKYTDVFECARTLPLSW